MNSFAKYFEQFLGSQDQRKKSANELIRRTGIDRSTFYHILGGRRIPTEEQYHLIRKNLLLTHAEEVELESAFVLDTEGDHIVRSRRAVAECFAMLTRSAHTDRLAAKVNLRSEEVNYYKVSAAAIPKR